MNKLIYIDLSDAPQEEVDEFIERIKKQIRDKKKDEVITLPDGITRVGILPTPDHHPNLVVNRRPRYTFEGLDANNKTIIPACFIKKPILDNNQIRVTQYSGKEGLASEVRSIVISVYDGIGNLLEQYTLDKLTQVDLVYQEEYSNDDPMVDWIVKYNQITYKAIIK